MATRRARRPTERSSSRISVWLDSDTHARLRALSLVQRATIQDIVAGWIERETAHVRLPSIGAQESPVQAGA